MYMKAEITTGRPQTPHARKRVFLCRRRFFSHPVRIVRPDLATAVAAQEIPILENIYLAPRNNGSQLRKVKNKKIK